MEAEIKKLKETIERLQRELAETTQEKMQAAEYGLAVLNEKQRLQTQVEALEGQIEASRNELELTRSAVENYNRIVKRQTQVGAEEDERRALEIAQRESNYSQQILDLEYELRSVKHRLDETRNENSQTMSQNSELRETIDRFERERVEMKRELRELRSRETRLSSEFSKLEDENIQLQKQIGHMRSSEIELETTRHEVARLEGELLSLTGQLDETVRLKTIIERQLEEMIVILQSEREQKYALKRELDAARVGSTFGTGPGLVSTTPNSNVPPASHNTATESSAPAEAASVNNQSEHLAASKVEEPNVKSAAGRTVDDGESAYCGSNTNDNANETQSEWGETESRCDTVSEFGNDERDVDWEGDIAGAPATPRKTNRRRTDDQNNLLSEVHLSELRRVQEVLAATESEKQELLVRLVDRDRQLEVAKRESLSRQQQLEKLHVYCAAISSLNEVAALQEDTTSSQSMLVKSPSAFSTLSTSASCWTLSHSPSLSFLNQPITEISSSNSTQKSESVESNSVTDSSTDRSKEREGSKERSVEPQLGPTSASKDRLLKQYEVRYAAALKQITSLTFELRRAENRLSVERSGKSDSQLRDDVVGLQSQVATLERDSRDRDNLLRSRTERISALRRVALLFATRYFDLLCQLASLPLALRTQDTLDSIRIERERLEKLPLLASELNDSATANSNTGDALEEASLPVEAELLNSLRRCAETASVVRQRKSETENDNETDPESADNLNLTGGASEADLREQIARLQIALAAKREQVSELRSLLKTNKDAAEQSMASLREKFEVERATTGDTVRRLRDELRTLKEEATQFTSVRCMLMQECGEYAAQLEQMRTLLRTADDERRTLSASLKVALSQKAALSQRVDSMQRDRERRPRRSGPRNFPSGGGGGAGGAGGNGGNGQRFGRTFAVYASQNSNTPRSTPIAIPGGYVNHPPAGQPVYPYHQNANASHNQFAVGSPGHGLRGRPLSSSLSTAETGGMYAGIPHYQTATSQAAAQAQPQCYDLTAAAASLPQSQAYDASYLQNVQFMQQMLGPLNGQPRTFTYQQMQASGAVDFQNANTGANVNVNGAIAAMYQTMAPTGIYASAANPVQAQMAGRMTASPAPQTHVTNSGSPSPFSASMQNSFNPN